MKATGGAASLLQTLTNTESKPSEAVRFIRGLARKHNSPALAKLATRLASSVRLADHSGDIVSKVKGLINYMIDKLETEGDMDATGKHFLRQRAFGIQCEDTRA